MDTPTPPSKETPQDIAARVARNYFGIGTDKASRSRAIRRFLVGAVVCAVLIPALFYVRFGEVPGVGWGVTVFLVAVCLVAAIGLYFQPRTEYHTPVPLKGDWLDRVGAYWLVSCAFGPLLGCVLTALFPLTAASWRWLYGLRVILAAALPVVTALPLTRYVRGKGEWVALLLLIGITLLPIWSAVDVSRDLWEGPVVRHVQTTGRAEWVLMHTGQSLGEAH